jgi:two-component system OmpR family sensor kinase
LVQIRNVDNDILCCNNQPSVSLPSHIALRPSSKSPDQATYFNAPSGVAGGPMFRVRASSLNGVGQVIVALPLDQLERTLHHQARVDLEVTTLALIGVVLLGWWLIRLSLRPLEEMEKTAAAIAEGDLALRVPGDVEPTEVGRLARTLNVMLTRIQDAFAARDATERQLRQSEERLRRFVADASHELRTPVAAVGAYAELFERGAATRPEDLARVLAGIRSETARMGELVEDLLLLARLDEGRPLEQQPVELVGLVAEAVSAAGAVGPDWPVRLEANHTVEVIGDAARLRQVVDNLLANVRAHTPSGTATVVRVGAREGSGVIEVSDNGPGLPVDTEGRVFERFYRADPSRSRQNGGAGLGLAIVAAIVAAHGGTVAASTTPGGGATFTLWLPAVPRPSTSANGAAPAHAPTIATPAVASDQ